MNSPLRRTVLASSQPAGRDSRSSRQQPQTRIGVPMAVFLKGKILRHTPVKVLDLYARIRIPKRCILAHEVRLAAKSRLDQVDHNFSSPISTHQKVLHPTVQRGLLLEYDAVIARNAKRGNRTVMIHNRSLRAIYRERAQTLFPVIHQVGGG